jgi:hypothetical protein
VASTVLPTSSAIWPAFIPSSVCMTNQWQSLSLSSPAPPHIVPALVTNHHVEP